MRNIFAIFIILVAMVPSLSYARADQVDTVIEQENAIKEHILVHINLLLKIGGKTERFYESSSGGYDELKKASELLGVSYDYTEYTRSLNTIREKLGVLAINKDDDSREGAVKKAWEIYKKMEQKELGAPFLYDFFQSQIWQTRAFIPLRAIRITRNSRFSTLAVYCRA